MRRLRTTLCLLVVVVLTAGLTERSAYAQAVCYANAPRNLQNIFTAASGLVVRDAPADDGSNNFDELVLYALAQAAATGPTKRELNVNRQETARTDKQVAASAGSNPITALASKPNFATLLSLAIEHGGVQKEVKDSVLTLSTSPYAFIAATSGDTAKTYQENDFFRRIGASAQFAISDDNDALASVRRQQLQNWSIRLRLSPDRSTRSADFETYWRETIAPKTMAMDLAITGALFDLYAGNSALKTWRENALQQFKTAVADSKRTVTVTDEASRTAQAQAVEKAMRCSLETLAFKGVQNGTVPLTPENRALLASKLPSTLAAAELAVGFGKEELDRKTQELDSASQLTLSYDNTRIANGGDYSSGEILFERKAFTPMKLVFNAGASLYHHPDPSKNQQQLRDVTAVLLFEGRSGRSPFLSNPDDASRITYSFAGSYKRLFENRHTANKKADIASVQFSLEFPIQGGLSFPIAFTYANTTETQNKQEARAQFGLTMDLDKLRSLALSAALRAK